MLDPTALFIWYCVRATASSALTRGHSASNGWPELAKPDTKVMAGLHAKPYSTDQKVSPMRQTIVCMCRIRKATSYAESISRPARSPLYLELGSEETVRRAIP